MSTDENKTTHFEEVDDMIAMNPTRNFATIIKKGKSRDFIKCMNASVPDKDFWDDCKKVSTIDNEEIKELREIYFGRKDG